jgi:hypothetical protein
MMLHTMVSSKNNVEEYSRLCNEMELEINSLLCPGTTDKDSEGMSSMYDLNVSKLSRIFLMRTPLKYFYSQTNKGTKDRH